MDTLSTLLNVVLPASIVLLAMYLTIRSFLGREAEKNKIELKVKAMEQVIPARLQAYERIVLLLERVSPQNMIPRVNNPEFNAALLRQKLLMDIREEFNHNLAQQLYLSTGTWLQTKAAIEETVAIINRSAEQVEAEAKSLELAKKIFDNMAALDNDPIQKALTAVKSEFQKLF